MRRHPLWLVAMTQVRDGGKFSLARARPHLELDHVSIADVQNDFDVLAAKVRPRSRDHAVEGRLTASRETGTRSHKRYRRRRPARWVSEAGEVHGRAVDR